MAIFGFPSRFRGQSGGPLSHSEVVGVAAIADSPDEVRLRAREQLRLGASQIKLMAGGGVSSLYNPIESIQYTEAEIACRGRGCRELGHLCHRACLHPALPYSGPSAPA